MFLLGLILLAAAVVFGVDELVNNNPVGLPDPQVFSQSLGVTSGRGLFLIGAATGAGALLGLFLFLAGLRHSASRRAARRQERRTLRQHSRDREALAEENQGLRQQLEEREAQPAPVPSVRGATPPVAEPVGSEAPAGGWSPAATGDAAGAEPATTANPAVTERQAEREAAGGPVVTRRRRWRG